MHVAQGFKDATGPPYAAIWVCFRFAKPRRGTAALWFKALFQKLQQPQHTRRCRSWTKMTVAVFVVQVCVLRIRSTANTSVLSIDHQRLLLVASPVTLWRGHVGSESIMNEDVGVSGPYNPYPLDAWQRLVQSQLLLVGPCCPNFHVAPEALKTTENDFGLPSKKHTSTCTRAWWLMLMKSLPLDGSLVEWIQSTNQCLGPKELDEPVWSKAFEKKCRDLLTHTLNPPPTHIVVHSPPRSSL